MFISRNRQQNNIVLLCFICSSWLCSFTIHRLLSSEGWWVFVYFINVILVCRNITSFKSLSPWTHMNTTSTNTYVISSRQQGQVPLDFIAVEAQAHVLSQLHQIWVQGWGKEETGAGRRVDGKQWGTRAGIEVRGADGGRVSRWERVKKGEKSSAKG